MPQLNLSLDSDEAYNKYFEFLEHQFLHQFCVEIWKLNDKLKIRILRSPEYCLHIFLTFLRLNPKLLYNFKDIIEPLQPWFRDQKLDEIKFRLIYGMFDLPNDFLFAALDEGSFVINYVNSLDANQAKFFHDLISTPRSKTQFGELINRITNAEFLKKLYYTINENSHLYEFQGVVGYRLVQLLPAEFDPQKKRSDPLPPKRYSKKFCDAMNMFSSQSENEKRLDVLIFTNDTETINAEWTLNREWQKYSKEMALAKLEKLFFILCPSHKDTASEMYFTRLTPYITACKQRSKVLFFFSLENSNNAILRQLCKKRSLLFEALKEMTKEEIEKFLFYTDRIPHVFYKAVAETSVFKNYLQTLSTEDCAALVISKITQKKMSNQPNIPPLIESVTQVDALKLIKSDLETENGLYTIHFREIIAGKILTLEKEQAIVNSPGMGRQN